MRSHLNRPWLSLVAVLVGCGGAPPPVKAGPSEAEVNAAAKASGEKQESDVSAEESQAIVCLVGDNIRYTPGVAGRVFTALRDINIRMISQGASLLNLSIVVAQDDLKNAVARLHAEFFSNPDQAVFAV